MASACILLTFQFYFFHTITIWDPCLFASTAYILSYCITYVRHHRYSDMCLHVMTSELILELDRTLCLARGHTASYPTLPAFQLENITCTWLPRTRDTSSCWDKSWDRDGGMANEWHSPLFWKTSLQREWRGKHGKYSQWADADSSSAERYYKSSYFTHWLWCFLNILSVVSALSKWSSLVHLKAKRRQPASVNVTEWRPVRYSFCI